MPSEGWRQVSAQPIILGERKETVCVYTDCHPFGLGSTFIAAATCIFLCVCGILAVRVDVFPMKVRVVCGCDQPALRTPTCSPGAESSRRTAGCVYCMAVRSTGGATGDLKARPLASEAQCFQVLPGETNLQKLDVRNPGSVVVTGSTGKALAKRTPAVQQLKILRF